MATSVTFNGNTYSIPANREPAGWGTSLSSFLVDVANSSLSKAGGNFTLTADANFGSNYGIVAKYVKSVSSNIAASGVVRLANTDKVAFRNNANGADLSLGVSTSDRLQFESVNIPTISSTDTLTNKTLTSPVINTPTGIVKGDVGLGNVDNTSDANKPVSTATQTALDLKANIASPTFTGTVLLQNSSGAQPELAFSEDPDNGTSKVTVKAPASLSADYTLTLPSDDGSANQVLQTDGSGGLSWASVATAASPTFTGSIGVPDGSVTVPALAFTSDADGSGTGLYRIGANNLGFAANGVSIGQYSSAGAWTLGPSTAASTVAHTIYGRASTLVGAAPMLTLAANNNATGDARLELGLDSSNNVGWLNITETGVGGAGLKFGSSNIEVGSYTSAGAWTLGPSSGGSSHTLQTAQNTPVIFKNTGATNCHIGYQNSGGALGYAGFDSSYNFNVYNNGGSTLIGTSTSAGAWTLGPSGFNDAHKINGLLGIDRTATSARLEVEGVNVAGRFYSQSSTTTQEIFSLYSAVGGAGTQKWRVEADGDTISSTGSYTSDERAKKLIRAIPYGLTELMQLNPSGYRWKHEADTAVESFSAATAQVLESVMPELVRDDGLDDGEGGRYKAIYTTELLAVVVKAVQELKAENDALRARIEALENAP